MFNLGSRPANLNSRVVKEPLTSRAVLSERMEKTNGVPTILSGRYQPSQQDQLWMGLLGLLCAQAYKHRKRGYGFGGV